MVLQAPFFFLFFYRLFEFYIGYSSFLHDVFLSLTMANLGRNTSFSLSKRVITRTNRQNNNDLTQFFAFSFKNVICSSFHPPRFSGMCFSLKNVSSFTLKARIQCCKTSKRFFKIPKGFFDWNKWFEWCKSTFWTDRKNRLDD